MSFILDVDGDRWRTHLRSVQEAQPGLVPVIKGNGYGFGIARLARRAAWLGVDRVAVGTYEEVPAVLSRFAGDVTVLTPWRPFYADVSFDPRVIHTVGRVADIVSLASAAPAGTRVLVEGMTSMSRHGLDRHSLAAAAKALGQLRVEGFAIHLPMTGGNLVESETWAAVLETSRIDSTTLYVSHLTAKECAELRERRPRLTICPRLGTSLWLGDLGALRVAATVLDVHEASRGERVGYRQRSLPRAGHVVVVAGGTSHGIGMEGPKAATGLVQRGKSVAKGGLEAAGMTLSPFTIAGRQRWFIEPPHMQASMLFLPESVPPPQVGDTVSAAVRFTTTLFDDITIS